MMQLIELKNPTDKDILDYRIEEIEFDQDGKPMLDDTGNPKKTGRTLEWSIKAGESLKFPDYVANYLKGIYGFLEVKGEETPSMVGDVPAGESIMVPPKEVAKPEEGGVICKFCGKSFRGMKGLGLHMAHNHPKELLKGVTIK
jgi:hypothetical protein